MASGVIAAVGIRKAILFAAMVICAYGWVFFTNHLAVREFIVPALSGCDCMSCTGGIKREPWDDDLLGEFRVPQVPPPILVEVVSRQRDITGTEETVAPIVLPNISPTSSRPPAKAYSMNWLASMNWLTTTMSILGFGFVTLFVLLLPNPARDHVAEMRRRYSN